MNAVADKKLVELAALDLRRELCRVEKLYNQIYFGLGTIEAHAKTRTLEEWIIAYGKAKG